MSVLKLLFVAWIVQTLTFGIANAADKDGRFMMGGGVGGVGCPSFLNAMATARQAGGLQSIAGSEQVVGFINYVAGFQTGFNSEHKGTFDIFGPMEAGPDRGYAELYALESWCGQHPEAKFGEAVLALAKTMLKNSP